MITGAAGQDGTYLADFLRLNGYEVCGIDVPGRAPRTEMAFYEVDLRDQEALAARVKDLRPDACYHLAAFQRSSAARAADDRAADEERASIETNLCSVQTMLAALHATNPSCRVFLAGSCHMFGDPEETPQSERTPFAPRNLYGITKTAAAHLGRFYRNEKGMFVCVGILYNHESPLRGPDFVTAKIARAAAEISRGRKERLTLGNLGAQVDWGFAGDYVEAMYAMLQAETPEDFIVATGELHTVGAFAEAAFAHVGLDWTKYVVEDAAAYRPVSPSVYCGDSSAIRRRLGWQPKTSFWALVEMMVEANLGA